jgi:hypothetical protein
MNTPTTAKLKLSQKISSYSFGYQNFITSLYKLAFKPDTKPDQSTTYSRIVRFPRSILILSSYLQMERWRETK